MSRIYNNSTEIIGNTPLAWLNQTAQKRGAAAEVPPSPDSSTRGQPIIHRRRFAGSANGQAQLLTKNLRGLTGSPEVLRRRTKHNRVIAKETAGKNTARFQPSTDIAGIRRLLGQAALSHASHRRVFSSFARTKPQPKKIVNL
jgi:hypothetical protein